MYKHSLVSMCYISEVLALLQRIQRVRGKKAGQIETRKRGKA